MQLTESEQFVVYVDISRTINGVLAACKFPEFTTADEAISCAKKIQDDIWRISTLSRFCDSDFQYCLAVLTNGLREAIAQVDVPATYALVDGDADSAINLCGSRLEEVWGRWQCRMTEYQARAQALAQLISEPGIPFDSEVFGCSIGSFLKLTSRELLEIVDGAKNTSVANTKLSVRDLATKFDCSEKTIRRLADENCIKLHGIQGRQRGKFAWSNELDVVKITTRIKDKIRD